MTTPQDGFPPAGIDGFLSHFVFTVRINKGDLAGQVLSYTWPASIQTVVRSEPFIYEGPEANHRVEFNLPEGADLPTTLTEEEFIAVPDGFFERGKETVWLQNTRRCPPSQELRPISSPRRDPTRSVSSARTVGTSGR